MGRKAKARADDQAVRLGSPGMTENTIYKRVAAPGKQIGIEKLSPHDLRHFWATEAAKNTGPNELRQAGGWKTFTMAARYIKDAQIANEGVSSPDLD